MRLIATVFAITLFAAAATTAEAGCGYKQHNQQSTPSSESTT